MLLADILCKTIVVVNCLVETCGKMGDSTLWVGRWCLSHLVLPQGWANGQGCPWQGSQREASSPGLLHSDSQLRPSSSACLLLTITLTKLTCCGLPLLRVDNSASCGSRECLMRLMERCNTCCTPGIACSAPSASSWQLSTHSGPPSHTKGSGSCHWSTEGHLGCAYPPIPWPLGTLMGVPHKGIWGLLVKTSRHNWPVAACLAPSTLLGFHKWQSLAAQHFRPCAWRPLSGPACYLWQSWGNAF